MFPVRSWERCSELLRAVQDNDLAYAQSLFDKGLDVDSIIYSGYFGRPAIAICVEYGFFQMAELLIHNGCSLSLTNGNGNTPLHLAAEKSDIRFVQLLLRNGANTKSMNHEKQVPLHMACARSASAEIVRLLTDQYYINRPDIFGRTPLIYACNNGCVDSVKHLLENGAEVNILDATGTSPLLYAIESYRSSPEMVTLLANAGADINHRNKSEDIPLLRAVLRCCPSGRIRGNSFAVKLDIVKLLIELGSDVNSGNYVGQTVLHLSVFYDDEELVRIFLNAESNVDAIDYFGNSPLFYACRDGKPSVAYLLVEAGAVYRKENWFLHETFNQYCNSQEILDYLKQKIVTVPRLDDICRTTLRKHMGKRMEMVISKLKLPLVISNYIRLIHKPSHNQP